MKMVKSVSNLEEILKSNAIEIGDKFVGMLGSPLYFYMDKPNASGISK